MAKKVSLAQRLFDLADEHGISPTQAAKNAKLLKIGKIKAADLTPAVIKEATKLAKAADAQTATKPTTRAAKGKSKVAPAKTGKASKAPATANMSNKERVHRAWTKDGAGDAKNAEKYWNMVNQEVNLSTVRSWISDWRRGVNLPGYVNRANKATAA